MRKRRVDHDTIGIIFFILFALAMSWQSLKLSLGGHNSPGPGLFPFLSAVVVGVLSLVLLIQKIRNQSGKTIQLKLGPYWRKSLYLTIITFFYIAVFWNALGYLVSTFLWLFAMFRTGGVRSWKKNILAPLAITIVSYFLLEKVAYCLLPRGILSF